MLALLLGCQTPSPEPQLVHVPLVGAHAELSCSSCHGDRLEAPVPLTCAGCHEADRPVPHDDGDCGVCHTEFDWELDAINHDSFPLTAGHDGPACTDCHGSADYADASPACTSCHAPPQDHFPGGCADCHDTRDWGAEFDHAPLFPLPHEGVSECSDCHLSDSYDAFTCTDCHEHRASDMNDEHDDVSGYSWSSPACLDCHPNGREDDAEDDDD